MQIAKNHAFKNVLILCIENENHTVFEVKYQNFRISFTHLLNKNSNFAFMKSISKQLH